MKITDTINKNSDYSQSNHLYIFDKNETFLIID